MWNWMMLGLESNRVIGLRMAKLMRGGKAAQREAQRMVSEKMFAAAKSGTSLMAAHPETRLLRNIEERWRLTPNGSAANESGANESEVTLDYLDQTGHWTTKSQIGQKLPTLALDDGSAGQRPSIALVCFPER
jgi:hypothetical protein